MCSVCDEELKKPVSVAVLTHVMGETLKMATGIYDPEIEKLKQQLAQQKALLDEAVKVINGFDVIYKNRRFSILLEDSDFLSIEVAGEKAMSFLKKVKNEQP